MVWCAFTKDGGLYTGNGERWRKPEHDSATEILVELDQDNFPDARMERWGGTALRPATEQEIAEYDDGLVADQADTDLKNPIVVASLDALWNLECRMRIAGIEADDPRIPETDHRSDLNSTNAPDKTAYGQALQVALKGEIKAQGGEPPPSPPPPPPMGQKR